MTPPQKQALDNLEQVIANLTLPVAVGLNLVKALNALQAALAEPAPSDAQVSS